MVYLVAFVAAISGNRLRVVTTQREVLSSQISVDHDRVIRISRTWHHWGGRVKVIRRRDSGVGSRDRTADSSDFDAPLFSLSSSV